MIGNDHPSYQNNDPVARKSFNPYFLALLLILLLSAALIVAFFNIPEKYLFPGSQIPTTLNSNPDSLSPETTKPGGSESPESPSAAIKGPEPEAGSGGQTFSQLLQIEGNAGRRGDIIIGSDGNFYLADNAVLAKHIKNYTIGGIDLALESITSKIILDKTITSSDLADDIEIEDLTIGDELSLDTLDFGNNTITDGEMSGNWNFGSGNITTTGTITAANMGNIGNTVSGTAGRITVSTGASPTVDIAADFVGQNSITTLGTIATGVWQGTGISVIYLQSTVMAEGENLSLLSNDAGFISASSSDTLTNKTWNGNTMAVAYGGTGTGNGSITGTSELVFAAGGTNENVILTPSGVGHIILNGNVGIGTTNPGVKVEINDNDSDDTTSGLRFSNFACSGLDKLTVTAGGDLICATDQTGSGTGNLIDTLAQTLGAGNDANALNITNIGRLNASLGAEDTPAFSFQADLDTGMWSSVANTLNFSTGGSERIRVASGGNIGFGTTNPTTALDVVGVITATGGTSTNWNTAYLEREQWSGTATGLNAATARTSLGLVIGTNVQAYDAALLSIASLSTSANQLIYLTASDTYATSSLTAFGRSLIDDSDNSTARTTLGLSSMAIATEANYALLGGRSGGQTLIGGSQTTDSLVLQTTSGVGTTGADIYFKVGDNGATTAMSILNSGNVGIGVANPLTKLHLYGITEAAGLVTDAGSKSGVLRLDSTAVGVGGGGSVEFGYAGKYFGAIKGYAVAASDNSVGNLTFFTRNAATDVSLTERMRIEWNGYIGIGTTNPGARLEINDNDSNILTSGLMFTNFQCSGTDKVTVTSGGTLICATDQTGSGTGNIIDTLAATLGAGNDANALDVSNLGRLYANRGLVTLPAFSFQLDPDTGMWSSLANTLNFSTGNQERIRIDSIGYIGIGKTSPVAKLHLYGVSEAGAVTDAGSKDGALRLDSTAVGVGGGGSVEFGYAGKYFGAIKGHIVSAADNSAGNLTFFTRNAVADSSLTERMRIEWTGDVGIGTTNPTYKLQVAGSLGISGTAYFASSVGIGTANPGAYGLNVSGDTLIGGDLSVDSIGGATFYADQYGTAHDGVTDDTAALTSALAAASDAGGGIVYLGPYRYLIDSGNLTIPDNVCLSGQSWTGISRLLNNYTAVPYTLIVNPSYSVVGGRNACIQNVFIKRKGLTTPTNTREAVTAINEFAGIGLSVPTNAGDFATRNVVIAGFDTCYQATTYRPIIEHLFGDCTTGIVVENAASIPKLRNIHMWELITATKPWTQAEFNITDITTSPSGNYRLTVSPIDTTYAFQTGDTVWVSRAGDAVGTTDDGAVGANGKWKVTVVDSTHIDLYNDTTYSTSTQTTEDSATVVVASSADLQSGQKVTGTGIPDNTTIISLAGNKVTLSRLATATGTATLTFANPSAPVGPETATSSTVLGYKVITVDSAEGIAVGQTVSGAGIPVGTKVDGISETKIIITNAATATASGVSLTFTNGSYISNSVDKVIVDANMRRGAGFYFPNDDALECVNCLVFGHNTGFHLGFGSNSAQFINASVDNNSSLRDPTTIGALFDSTSNGTSWNGGVIWANHIPVKVNSANGSHRSAHSFSGVAFGPTAKGIMVDIEQGELIIAAAKNTSSTNDGKVLVESTVGHLTIAGSDIPYITLVPENSTAKDAVSIDGSTRLAEGSAIVGNPFFNSITLGASSSAYKFQVVVDGSNEGHVTSTGDWARTSDLAYKKNITTLTDTDNPFDAVMKLRAVRYDSLADTAVGIGQKIGFIAQEVENVLPEFVDTDPEGRKSITYAAFVPVLTAAIQQQKNISDSQGIKIASLGEKNIYLASNFNNLNSRLDVLTQKIAGVSLEALEFYDFKKESDVLSNLADPASEDDSFGGTYVNNGQFQEVRIEKKEALDLAKRDVAGGFLEFDVYMEDADTISDFVTELGNKMDAKELQWNKLSHPYFMDGWNRVRLPLDEGIKTGEVDWSGLDYFRIYMKFSSANKIAVKNIKLEIKSKITNEEKLAFEGKVFDLRDPDSQAEAIRAMALRLENNTLETSNNDLSDGIGEISGQPDNLKLLEDQLNLIDQQNQAVIEFTDTLDLGSLVYKNGLGNLDLGEGKITASDIKVGGGNIENLNVKVLGVDSESSGKAIIPAGENEIRIKTPQAVKDSKIYITVEGSSYGKNIFYEETAEGESFMVKYDGDPVDKDIRFNWLIIK